MPDKNLTVVSYAAGAGLAAIALVYVFAPTYLIDRKNAVGLRNVGNDCFINSVLQALAGLGTLRLYLIRETHRRDMDGDGFVYGTLVPPREEGRKKLREWELRSLQNGAVTRGLKEILDRLNERSIAKKTISPKGFVGVLERAFGQTINRQQQDAQEFLQLLVEKLRDEYTAGRRAREHARKAALGGLSSLKEGEDGEKDDDDDEPQEQEEGFPLEGEHEAQSECRTCGYKTKPKKELFCILTLAVPQVASTSLNTCFDVRFKTEHIEDFKCENCRLLHAKELAATELEKSTSPSYQAKTQERLDKIQKCLDTDPESPPKDLELPDIRFAPKRTISRHHRITRFPKILVVHLSRSIYDQTSQKNLAKVSFPEVLPLGGLRDQKKKYRLLGLVTHRGGHQSGHYQSFRRQVVFAPYSNPNTTSDVYKTASPAATPQMGAVAKEESPMVSTSDLLGDSSGSGTSTMSLVSGPEATSRESSKESVPLAKPAAAAAAPTPANPKEKDRSDASSIRSVAASARSTLSKMAPSVRAASRSREVSGTKGEVRQGTASSASAPGPRPNRRKTKDRWWRINDDKCREARTSEVLESEREVYLLFYELEEPRV